MKISDKTAISMPMRNLLSIVAAVAVGVWAYFGVIERLNKLETQRVLIEKDMTAEDERLHSEVTKNTEFRIKYPRGELGQSSQDIEQFMLIEDLYKTVDRMQEHLDSMANNKINIEFLEKQMEKAHENGANWCNYGWSKDQMALFPTQKSTWDKLQDNDSTKNNCGRPGINGGVMSNPALRFGVNCYGVKPSPKGDEIQKNSASASLTEEELKKAEYEGQLNDIRVSPFSENSWSGCSV